jgi:serine/threonine-protein kinase SRPK3
MVLPLSDIKPDNILFNIGEDPVSMKNDLAADPPSIDGEVELNGTSYPVMLPQPLPHDFVWNDGPLFVERYDFVLDDIGHGACVIV